MENDSRNTVNIKSTMDGIRESSESLGEWFKSFTQTGKSSNNATTATNSSENDGASHEENDSGNKSWMSKFSFALPESISSSLTKSSGANSDYKAFSAEVTTKKQPEKKVGILQDAITGQEKEHVTFIPEYDSVVNDTDDSTKDLSARVATVSANPFSCVVGSCQSFSSALSSRFMNVSSKEVHGVSSSPLLAVPDAGRYQEKNTVNIVTI